MRRFQNSLQLAQAKADCPWGCSDSAERKRAAPLSRAARHFAPRKLHVQRHIAARRCARPPVPNRSGTSHTSARRTELRCLGSTNVFTIRLSASSVPLVSSNSSGLTPKNFASLAADRFLFRIRGNRCGAEFRERAAHRRRAADRILVEIQAQLFRAPFERRIDRGAFARPRAGPEPAASFAHLHRARAVRCKTFRPCEFLDDWRETPQSRARNFLHADAFHEIRNGKPAARARHAAGRQHVIRAARIIAKRSARSSRREKCCPPIRFGRASRPPRPANSNAPAQTDSRSRAACREISSRSALRHFSRASATRDSFSEAPPIGARFPPRRSGQAAQMWSRISKSHPDRAPLARSNPRR